MSIKDDGFPADDPGGFGMGQDDPDSDEFIVYDDDIDALLSFDDVLGVYPLYL